MVSGSYALDLSLDDGIGICIGLLLMDGQLMSEISILLLQLENLDVGIAESGARLSKSLVLVLESLTELADCGIIAGLDLGDFSVMSLANCLSGLGSSVLDSIGMGTFSE